MRIVLWLVALVVGLGVASPAWAQRPTPFATIPASDLKFTPINVTALAVAPLPTVPNRPFSLRNMFSTIHLTNFLSGPGIGTSPLPPATSFPSTHYKSPLQPVMPIR